MTHITPPPYALVIDTDSYAGNYERPLCGWFTGVYGECEVGIEEAAAAYKELPPDARDWLEENVLSLPDEHGCSRPVSIWPGPGTPTKYTAVAIWLNDTPPHHVLAAIQERALTYNWRPMRREFDSDVKVTGYRLLRFKLTIEEVQP